MSFQLDGSFPILQLAYSTHSHAKKACSQHDPLPQELQNLQNSLSNWQSSTSNPNSPIHQARKSRRQELKRHVEECETQLRRLKAILKKYNSLSEDENERIRIPLWEKVRFSNGGPVENVGEMKRRVSMYGTVIEMLLHLLLHGDQGGMERAIGRLRGEMKGVRRAIDLVLAKPCGDSCGKEGALMMSYSPNDRSWWRELRRGLVRSGYDRKVISGNMDLVQGYVKELGDRGAFEHGRNHSRSLGNGGFEDPFELEDVPYNRGYGNDLILEAPVPRHAVSVQIRRIGFLEEQLLHAPDLWIERMEEDDDTESSDSDSSTPTLLTENELPHRDFHESFLYRSGISTPQLAPHQNYVTPLKATRMEKHSKNNKKSRKHRQHREHHSEKHRSDHRSHPMSVPKSSSSSGSKSDSDSSFIRSFWGFKQRPKQRAR